MTDLEELEALLHKWGVPFQREDQEDATGLIVGDLDVHGLTPSSPKVTGYSGFYTSFEFGADGAFARMGAWE